MSYDKVGRIISRILPYAGTFIILVFIVSLWLPFADVCEKSPYTNQENCSTHHISYVILWYIGQLLEAHASAITALATIAIGYFTWTLQTATTQLSDAGDKQIAIAAAQTDIATKAHALARLQFFATHRPRIRVRRIDHVVIGREKPITAKIEFSNIGSSEATIEQIGIDLYFRRIDNPTHAKFDARPFDNMPPISVQPGKSAVVDFIGRYIVSDNDSADFIANKTELCAMGIINYTDGMGNMRATSIFRIFNPSGKRFFPAPNDACEGDREYED